MTMDTLFSIVKQASNDADKIEHEDIDVLPRSAYSILSSITSELGELADEVNIEMGHSYKKPGQDGIVGESVDIICSTLDLIHLTHPELTEQDIIEIAKRKCHKWLSSL